MRRADVLNDFPFTFTREATQIQVSDLLLFSYLLEFLNAYIY